MSNTVISLKS